MHKVHDRVGAKKVLASIEANPLLCEASQTVVAGAAATPHFHAIHLFLRCFNWVVRCGHVGSLSRPYSMDLQARIISAKAN